MRVMDHVLMLLRGKALSEQEHELVSESLQILKAAAVRIAELEDAVQSRQELILFWQHQTLAVASGWRISVERPEEDVRDELDTLLTSLRDIVGQTEEFVT